MGLYMSSAAFVVLGAAGCAADTFCADIEALAEPNALHVFTLPAAQSGAMSLARRTADCRSSRAVSGARHVHCSWSFEYRSDAAATAFQRLTGALAGCLGPDVSMTVDSSVNHPDAYDLRIFDRKGQEFAVSVKDKGALQQTLVFIRVQQR